ncbi:MAG: L-threonylcarbamoyladenylate synthase [Patescibacteria group bacterium]|nr:L-threonylcarbamoyladenylate synthase [Patescibacteria group bacterium]
MEGGNENLIKVLQDNGVVVMPTDTLYGIVGKALSSDAVERIYVIRKRAPQKPCIILIGEINELEKFSITLSSEQKEKLKEYWSFDNLEDRPAPISIVLDCPNDRFTYLHRGTNTLAFRLPYQKELQNLLLKTGPLIAPSANLEGLPPARNIFEAKEYFGNLINLYIDGGELNGKASKVIKLHKDGSVTIIRE